VPAIYAEYEGGGRCSPLGIEAYIEGCLNVMGHLGMIDRELPPSHVELVVEDPRPQSGHIQRCYPAPTGGIFEPAVELGQRIEAGQPLGGIVNPVTGAHQTVVSTQNGRVLVLRTFPAVRAGDSLAVVLDWPLEAPK
jgi:predicted deacylase